jgi:hypothetical protein
MRVSPAAILTLLGVVQMSAAQCELEPIPINEDDFSEPDWETIIELAFPPWTVPEDGCPRLDSVGGELEAGFETFPTPEDGKFNPCYYTKAFAGLDPSKGGYPTNIDTHYPYEFAAPFLMQPGDGSVHHCAHDAENIGACPKLGNTCGPDCATITDVYGIGHIPPHVPLAAIKKAYNSTCEDICGTWFHYETSGCNIKKSMLDELVYQYFGDEDTIKYQPPILIDGAPSTTYYRLEYAGESPGCDDDNCYGPHYCSKDVADTGVTWGDFCPYVHTEENAGKYRHAHLALAALELWIANQCMPDKCDKEWLNSPNGQGYGADAKTSTSITWSEMDDNENPMAQPAVPYEWPNSGDGIFPGHELYDGKLPKPVPGFFVTEFVTVDINPSDDTGSAGQTTGPFSSWLITIVATVCAMTAGR